MRWLFITVLIFPLSLFAQKKLPVNCTELKSKLLLFEKSFQSFEKWKKQPIGGRDYQWTTNQTFCGVKGIIEIFEGDGTVELIFDFTGYEATDAELKAYVKKLTDAITQVFDHLVYSFDKMGGEESEDWFTHRWDDYRINGSVDEEVELSYPGIDTPLVLRFKYKK